MHLDLFITVNQDGTTSCAYKDGFPVDGDAIARRLRPGKHVLKKRGLQALTSDREALIAARAWLGVKEEMLDTGVVDRIQSLYPGGAAAFVTTWRYQPKEIAA